MYSADDRGPGRAEGDGPGDRRAFEALLAEHLSGLRARARQLCRTRLDPDDLVQDALVRAFRSRAQLRDPACARSWLMSIIMNTFLDALRRQQARVQADPIEGELVVPGEEPSEPLPWQRISREALHDAIGRLPDDVRETYRLFAVDGRDYVAIADAQGIPKGTVGTRIMRARRKLREILAVAIAEGS